MTLGELIKKAETLRDKHGEHFDVLVESDGVLLGASDIEFEVADFNDEDWNISEGDKYFVIGVFE